MHLVTRPQTRELTRARQLLAALVEDLPGTAGFPAWEALALLEDVTPPYPPIPALHPAVSVGVEAALEALVLAIGAAPDLDEAGRAAQAARCLLTPLA